MTTDSEQRLRALLDDAAPEPRRVFDGAQLRRLADDMPRDVQPLRRHPMATTLSVVFVVAAVAIAALVAVGLVNRGDHDATPAGPGLSHQQSAPPSTSAGPPSCGTDLVLQAGKFDQDSGPDGRVTLIIHDNLRTACTVYDLPTVQLQDDGSVTAVRYPSQYSSARSVVVRPSHPARIAVTFGRTHRCAVGVVSKTRIVLAMDGAEYGFDLPARACRYSIRSASITTG